MTGMLTVVWNVAKDDIGLSRLRMSMSRRQRCLGYDVAPGASDGLILLSVTVLSSHLLLQPNEFADSSSNSFQLFS
jgi:hypothetical protein